MDEPTGPKAALLDWDHATAGSTLPISARLYDAVVAAIQGGRLRPGDRLPSRRDLAAQLGIAPGTVEAAYDRLHAAGLVEARGSAGTHVARMAPAERAADADAVVSPLPAFFPGWQRPSLPFQGGVPAEDAFPRKTWSRLLAHAVREQSGLPLTYPDPRGDADLRREIASYLGLARGFPCTKEQVFVTSGFAGGVGLVILALRLAHRVVWMEEPGFPLTRLALQHGGATVRPVPVDRHGLMVAEGERLAPEAAAAIVTPGQHAPLGMTLSRDRRQALLAWAARAGAWIIEDDYLGEMQLEGRAAPALASAGGRAIHVGSFSKTISPALRLGFVVVPPDQVPHFGEVAATLAPAPAPVTQRATARFMAEGHFLRHLRRTRALYVTRRNRLSDALREAAHGRPLIVAPGGNFFIPVLSEQPFDDVGVAASALAHGAAPVPLSPWYAGPPRHGLLFGITNAGPADLASACARVLALTDACG